jgi:translocation and assembly module TamB
MKKKVIIGLLSPLALVVALILAGIIYIRSGRLDLWLQSRIIEELRESNIRAEIGSTRLDLSGRRVKLQDLRLYSLKGGRPLGTIQQLEAEFSIADYFRRRIKLNKVVLIGPHWIIEVDEKGRSNLESLRLPPRPREEREEKLIFLTALFHIEGGQISFADRARDLTVALRDMSADFVPVEGGRNVLDHLLKLSFGAGEVALSGRKVGKISARLEAHLKGDGADIKFFGANSDLGEISARGQMLSYRPVEYKLSFGCDISLGKLVGLLVKGSDIRGEARFEGSIEGKGPDYRLVGDIKSGSVFAGGLHVFDILAGLNLEGSGASYQLRADIRAGPASGRARIEGFRLRTALGGKGSEFESYGRVEVARLWRGPLFVSGLSARINADPNRIALSDLSASLLGGRLSGSAAYDVAVRRTEIDVGFSQVALERAFQVMAFQAANLRGQANGRARLVFCGFDYEAAVGKIEANFDSQIGQLSATGQLELDVVGREFKLNKAALRSDKSRAELSGSFNWDGDLRLRMGFETEDLAEIQIAAEELGLLSEDFKDRYQLELGGAGRFDGSIMSKLSAPAISGRINLSGLKSHGEELGSFEGEILYEQDRFKLGSASLVMPDGSRADFWVEASLSPTDLSLKAKFENFQLPSLVRALAPELTSFFGGGIISGQVDLRHLGDPRAIEGWADVSLLAADFNLPAQEESKQKRVSVQEFRGRVSVTNRELSAEGIRVRFGESAVSGRFRLNLDNYAYSVDLQGENLDLGRISDAVFDSEQITGRADARIAGQGLWDDWAATKLNALIAGRNLTVHGQSISGASLAAISEGGLLKLELKGKLFDKEQSLTASIDLSKPDYPINSKVEFADVDLGPYLGLIWPELSKVLGRASGQIVLGGPLSDPGRLAVVARLSKVELSGPVAEGRRYSLSNKNEVVISADPNGITVEPIELVGEGTSLSLSGRLSSRDGDQKISISGQMNLGLISSFTRMVYAAGLALIRADVVGSVSQPRIIGSVELRDVGFRVSDFPVSIVRGGGRIRFTMDQAIIDSFVASSPGGGGLSITGGALFAGLKPDRWRLEARADQVAVEYPRATRTVFDGNFVLQGDRRFQVLSGDVRVRRADYTRDLTLTELITTGGPFGPEFIEAGGEGAQLPISLDIRISADNTIIVRNNLADALASAHLSLRGPISDPVISGRLQLARGTIRFRGEPYEITRGIVTIPAQRGAAPIFDFQGERDISGYRVKIMLSGPPERLQARFRSDPELPENDVIWLVLSGQLANGRSAMATRETGLTLAQSLIAASLSEQIERGTQRIFGLSRFSIDPLVVGRGSDPTARLTLGQRITKDLTITYSQNLTNGPSGLERIVLIEYRISDRFSIVATRDERGEMGFNVRIRKRF